MKLYAPKEWWEALPTLREEHCNGCGSELDLTGKLVPNTLYGLNVRVACCVHDWMYIKGETQGDRLFADAVFLLNMTVIILAKGGWLCALRLLRASKYFAAVAWKGGDSFFHEKEENGDYHITFKGEFRDYKEEK